MGTVCVEPWMIRRWPVREWYMPDDPAEWPTWWHMGTRVRAPRDEQGRWQGDTVWAATLEGVEVAATWSWTELRPGVVVLSDPNGIESNLRCVGATVPAEEGLSAMVALNRLAHELPWCETVCTILRMVRRHSPAKAEPARVRSPRRQRASVAC